LIWAGERIFFYFLTFFTQEFLLLARRALIGERATLVLKSEGHTRRQQSYPRARFKRKLMRTSLKVIFAGTLLTLVAFSPKSFAATNPSEATTTSSTGSSDMTVTIPVLVKISDIGDLFTDSTPDYDGAAANLTDDDNVCVFSNMSSSVGTNDYSVTMTGSGAASAFTLGCSSGDCTGDTISYTAFWNDQTGTSGETQVTTNVALTSQTGWSNSLDCGASTNANFRVNFTKTELLNNAFAGDYTGTLTIVITPTP
jgi:hypothetical protein